MAFGLVLRLAWVALCPNEPVSDPWIYHVSAQRMAAGQGYVNDDGSPAGWWPVGYPALLSVAYRLFGAECGVAFAVNVLLGMLTIVGTFLMTRMWFGVNAARWAALVVALHPTLVLYTTVIGSENAVLPGLTFSLWLLGRCGSGPSWVLALCAGIAIGLTTYVRATVLPLPLVMPVMALCRRWPWGRTLALMATVSFTAVLLLLPWGLRNQSAFGRFSLVSLNGAANLWMGNHEGGHGSYVSLPDAVAGMSLVERETYLKNEALAFIASHPLAYVQLCLKRTAVTLRSDTIAAVWNEPGLERRFDADSVQFFKLLCTGAHLAVLLGAALAFLVGLRRRLIGPHVEALFVALMLAAPFVLIVGGNRYHLPLIPILVAAAASWVSLLPSRSPGKGACFGDPVFQPRGAGR